MKKFLFLSIVGAIALAMTSCEEKKAPQNIEEPIVGTDYVVVTTPDGAKGVMNGTSFVVEPKLQYKAFEFKEGMFLAKTGKTIYLLNQNGTPKISADTIILLKNADQSLFEGRRRGNYVVYIPSWNKHLVAQHYAVKGAYAIYSFGGKITICKDGKKIVEPTGDFAKVALLPEGGIIALKGKNWVTATVKEKALVAGKKITPKDLKKYQAMTGWDENLPVMILE